MCNGRKRFRISLILLATLLLSYVTLAQVPTVPTHDWSGLTTLSSEGKLVKKTAGRRNNNSRNSQTMPHTRRLAQLKYILTKWLNGSTVSINLSHQTAR